MSDRYDELRNLTAKRKKEAEARQKNVYKQKLCTDIEKRMRTTFIGNLSTIEEFFGFLWGFTDIKDMTDDEKKIKRLLESAGYDESYFESLFQEMRGDILTKGNNQLRATQEEVSKYSISIEKNIINLPIDLK